MLVSLNVVNSLNHDTARATLDQCRPASARPARGQWQSPPGGPGYLQRLKRKPGLLGCAEEALEVAVEYFTGLAAAENGVYATGWDHGVSNTGGPKQGYRLFLGQYIGEVAHATDSFATTAESTL